MNQTKLSLTRVAALALLTLTPALARAADATGPSLTDTNATPESLFNPVTLGLETGTTGAGIKADWRFVDHLGVRGGFDYFRYSYNGKIKDNNFDAHLRLQSEPLTLDLYPSKNSSFHISGGVMFNQLRLNGSATGSINLNGNSYNGTATLDIKPQAVDPYLSLGGNLYFDRAHHWSLGGEFGVAYMGNPHVDLNVTPANQTPQQQSDVQAEQDKIRHYARDAKFWPVLKFSVNYSF